MFNFIKSNDKIYWIYLISLVHTQLLKVLVCNYKKTDTDFYHRVGASTASGTLGQINSALRQTVELVRTPFSISSIQSVASGLQDRGNIVRVMTKSYTWWQDDPWIAFVALGAIVILLALVGIIILFYSWSRSDPLVCITHYQFSFWKLLNYMYQVHVHAFIKAWT